MVVEQGYESVGYVLMTVFVPLHILSLIWFIMRRRHFPISGRHPNFTIALMLLLTPPFFWMGYQFYCPRCYIPCWASWWFYAPLLLSFIPVTTIRATILLVQCSITKDLAAAEKARARARERYQHREQHQHQPQQRGDGGDHQLTADGEATPPAWKPGWFTQRRHWLRGRRFFIIVASLPITYALAIICTAHLLKSDHPGTDNCLGSDTLDKLHIVMAVVLGVTMAPFGLWLVVVSWNLRKHAQDAFGMMNEFRWMFVLMAVPIVIIEQQFDRRTIEVETLLETLTVWFSYIIVWCSICLWPIYMSYYHQRRLRQRLALMTNAAKLCDFLEIDEAYQAFVQFAAHEFTSEAVLFWKRVKDFRDGGVMTNSGTMRGMKQQQQPSPVLPHAAATLVGFGSINSVAPLPIPVAAAGTTVLIPPMWSPPHSPVIYNTSSSAHSSVPPHQLTSEEAQKQLLVTLVECNAIFAYYLADQAPNELTLPADVRQQVRAAIDSLLVRAATAMPLSSIVQLHHGDEPALSSVPIASSSSQPPTASMPLRVITRKGVSVSCHLSSDDARAMELEARSIFNDCQHSVITQLDASSFARFRASGRYRKLIQSMQGVTTGRSPTIGHDGDGAMAERRKFMMVAAAAVAAVRVARNSDEDGANATGIAAADGVDDHKQRRTPAADGSHRIIVMATPAAQHDPYAAQPPRGVSADAAPKSFRSSGGKHATSSALVFDPSANNNNNNTGGSGGTVHYASQPSVVGGVQSMLTPSEANELGFGGLRLGSGGHATDHHSIVDSQRAYSNNSPPLSDYMDFPKHNMAIRGSTSAAMATTIAASASTNDLHNSQQYHHLVVLPSMIEGSLSDPEPSAASTVMLPAARSPPRGVIIGTEPESRFVSASL